nr:small basic family protein [Parafrankia discariae]
MTGLFALVVGVVVGLLLAPKPPTWLDPYLPVAVVAAVDAAVGGLRAALERVFSDRVFVVSFLSNVLLAVALVALGDALGVGGAMSTAVVVVLGIRIFTNASAVRRSLLKL